MRRPGTLHGLIGLAGLAALLGAGYRLGWHDLWLKPDQRGRVLMNQGRAAEAAKVFRDPLWRGVALFRNGDFKAAAQAFAASDRAEGAFNQANAFVMLGQYDEALKRYDRALALRPGWPEATGNREIARIRGERRKAEGGVTDDTESKPDEIVFDKTKKGGEDTDLETQAPMSDEAVRALWLKRVQTRPADFLKAKFAYQLTAGATETAP
ncbi:tetratricopeptide repeat protein [Bosea caraganae]|uniref:Tetratricopeptide repeat protein n=1 Tax=Bosea caraganae TaxID=2763117 RepID=A0A370KXH9_9HYPH|nr:tetratricopeptide repeat protein [Bosea caraganae]RDJ19678.1 tetratricopeptide repeat protein [Bosea caraganae]RDJ23823.1 tetratricopeptide repeat protein [Bosea caraganae]